MNRSRVSRLVRPLLCLLVLTALAGCPLRQKPDSGPARPETPGKPIETLIHQGPQVPPPPAESDLALKAAEEAEAREDYDTALELYDWARAAQRDADEAAEIRYRMARLRAEGGAGQQDLDAAAEDFRKLIDAAPDHPRAREARIFVSLIEGIGQERARAQGLQAELEAEKARVATLREDLEKKDQELKSIKNVLLKKEP